MRKYSQFNIRNAAIKSDRVGPRKFPLLIFLAAMVVIWLSPDVANAQSNRTISIESDSSVYAGYIPVALNKSKVLRVSDPVQRLLLGNEDIADVMAVTDRTVYVLGKAIGTTSLSIYGANQKLIAVLDLEVVHDSQSLKRQLFQLMPREKIEVRTSSGGLVLSGAVSTGQSAATAAAIAEQFAPGQVSNFLTVQRSEQVMLKVRFAEIKRTAAKALGFHTDALFDDGVSAVSFASGFLNPDAFASVLGSFVTGNFNVDYLLDALETKGILTTLAEPSLIAMSGETASFLAGGEFPIPVVQGGGASTNQAGGVNISSQSVTVQFKEFGVSLAFTPTVIGDVINLVVAPEVSALDHSNSVRINGFVVPGLVTRRAQTTVELRNGQSFAIAGLLQNQFENNIEQIPGFGKIPIIGALLRSTEYQREETELLIVVTPYLVQPDSSGNMSLPTDKFVRPSEFELFFLGKVEDQIRSITGNQLSDSFTSKPINESGGLDGVVGYVVE